MYILNFTSIYSASLGAKPTVDNLFALHILAAALRVEQETKMSSSIDKTAYFFFFEFYR